MRASKLSFEESLGKVVSAGECVGCAACVVACPLACLEYHDEQPRLVKKCETCGICPRVCPRYNVPWSDIEEFVFGRAKKPTEEFGIYRRIVVARSNDENVLKVCQDGGVATSLLKFALEEGMIDGAAVSGVSEDRPLYPLPELVTTPQEVLRCAGTRYTYSPNLLAFREGVKRKVGSLAFVGTPCQVLAVRRIQKVPLKKYATPLRFVIGLMCTESFAYEGLLEGHIQKELGINLRDIRKINIKARLLVTLKSGDVKSISLAEAKRYTRRSCTSCTDFSSELADISLGGLGLSGWTVCVLRTEVGENLFKSAEEAGALTVRPIEEEKGALNLLVKLSRRKSRRR